MPPTNVRAENPSQLITGTAAVPISPKVQQVLGRDDQRDTATIVNEGTVDLFAGGNKELQALRIPTGGERTFTHRGPVYLTTADGAAVEGFVRYYVETFAG